ncbi:MAG: hypothetical protein NT149_04150 [Candidatus Gottesmanbacteria bacterium]|nr:hypothetical protein [Candidatus Gottesmanbacteria bacterium]
MDKINKNHNLSDTKPRASGFFDGYFLKGGWLHILGNDETLTVIVHNQNILHADLQARELVQKVVTDPIFQAFDTIYREEIETNPKCADGDLRQIDQKFKGLAEQTCAAHTWVHALQGLKVVNRLLNN